MSNPLVVKPRVTIPSTLQRYLIPAARGVYEGTGLLDGLTRQCRVLCRAAGAAYVVIAVCDDQATLARVMVDRTRRLEGGRLGPWLPPVPERSLWLDRATLFSNHPNHGLLSLLTEEQAVGLWSLGALRTGEPVALYLILPTQLDRGEMDGVVADAMTLLIRELDWVGRQLEIVANRERAALEVAELFQSLGQVPASAVVNQTALAALPVPAAKQDVELPPLLQVGTLVEHLDAGVLVEDVHRTIRVCNRRLCQILGLAQSPTQWVGASSVEFEHALLPALFDPETFEASTDEARNREETDTPEVIMLCSLQVLERRCSALRVDGVLLGYLWTYRDVTAREQDKQLLERQTSELRQLSLVDELTGLYNRRGYLTIANQHIRLLDRDNQKGLVVFLDLNNMKAVNDQFGHDQGDRALIQTANIIRFCFRSSDVMARLGGDEFIVFAIGAGDESIDVVTERLYQRLKDVNAQAELPFELSFSIGAAEYAPCRGEMFEEVIARADGLMYESKRRAKAARQ